MAQIWQKTLESLKADKSYKNMFSMMGSFGDKVAAEMTDRDGSEIIRTYNDYVRLSKAAAANLEKLVPEGFSGSGAADSAEGRTIGFMYDTCMDWPVIFWGILMTGGIPLLMNPMAEAGLSAEILNEAGAKYYISSKPIPSCDKQWINADELLAVSSDTAEPVENWSEYVALCTSGTTGSSRIFLYDSTTIATHILSFDEAHQANPNMPFDDGKPCKLLAFLPFHHVFGFSVIYILYSITGQTLVYMKDKSVNTLLSTCQNHGITHLYCVPLFFNALAKGIRKQLPSYIPMIGPVRKKIQSKTLGTSILSMITGGGHVSEETLKLINKVGYPLVNGFGMTESGIVSVETSTDPKQRIKGSMGIPFKITEYRIEDKKGHDSNAGELLLRGDALYTASIIDKKIVMRDKSAWFRTGDLVLRNADGLFINGRIKDVIINASGENVYPDELEDKFSGLPGTAKACVLGISNGEFEEVALVLEAAENADRDTLVQEVKKINSSLDSNHKATMLFLSKKPLPVSGSMKVKRQVVREMITGAQGKEGSDIEDLKLYGTAKVSGVVAQTAEADKHDVPQAAAFENEEEFKEIIASIRECVKDNFELEDEKIDNYSNFVAELGGDSLAILNIIAELDDKYGITILEENMAPVDNIHDLAVRIYELKHR